ncbi:uncharacterized protein B0I36DRAFT_34294 [Microdochium trichocladiopsis]|uniref:Uncharacterized protein n=1 Tax=Microdochium trichocladiopsis TaxID=1682393 RepID=A0A9P8XZZ0_9PEZI|nr:uncharacterized protein B0I36DRAFT_34294 [Microdochium trichocladiopsis]KAH7021639.1 hypothetical protein B0I36DRAFT_34294 [Microdochium trichocladiopsis]
MDVDTTHTCGSSEDCRWHVVAALLGDGDWTSILVKVQCFEARVRQDPGLRAAIVRLLPQSSRAPFHPDGSLPHRVQEPMQRCQSPNRSEQPSHAGIGRGQAAAPPPARLPQPTSHNIDQPPVARRPVQRCQSPKPTGQPRHQGLGADQIAASGLVSPVTRRSQVTSSELPIPPSEVRTMDTDQQTRARSSRQGEIAMTSAESATCGTGASRQGNDGGAPPARKPSGTAHIKLGERLEKLLRVWSEKPEKFFKLGIIPDENDTDVNEASENETDENESACSTYLFITDKLNSRLRNVAKLIWHLHRRALKRDGRKIQEQLLAEALHFRPEDVKQQCASLWGEGESFLGIVENLDTNYAVLLCLPEKKKSPDFYKNLRAKNPTALERLVRDMKSSGIESEVGRHKKTMEKIVKHGLSLLVNQNVDLGLQTGMCIAESTPADSREKHRKRTRLLSSSVADSGSSAMDHDIMAASSAVSVIGHPTRQSYKRARTEPPSSSEAATPATPPATPSTFEAANEASAGVSAITDGHQVTELGGPTAPRPGAGVVNQQQETSPPAQVTASSAHSSVQGSWQDVYLNPSSPAVHEEQHSRPATPTTSMVRSETASGSPGRPSLSGVFQLTFNHDLDTLHAFHPPPQSPTSSFPVDLDAEGEPEESMEDWHGTEPGWAGYFINLSNVPSLVGLETAARSISAGQLGCVPFAQPQPGAEIEWPPSLRSAYDDCLGQALHNIKEIKREYFARNKDAIHIPKVYAKAGLYYLERGSPGQCPSDALCSVVFPVNMFATDTDKTVRFVHVENDGLEKRETLVASRPWPDILMFMPKDVQLQVHKCSMLVIIAGMYKKQD